MTTTSPLTSRPASRSRFVLHTSGSGHLWNTLFLTWGSNTGSRGEFFLALYFCNRLGPYFKRPTGNLEGAGALYDQLLTVAYPESPLGGGNTLGFLPTYWRNVLRIAYP